MGGARLAAALTLLLLSSALGLRSANPADGADSVAAARRLREQAATLAALPDTGSGITRDVGSIAVIEHDGSNYDAADPDGTPRYAARAPVALRFYQTHGDNYDFLVVFTNFEFDTHIDGGSAIAFHNLVRNDVLGTGQAVGDSGALFGSPGRLLGYVDMANVARYGKAPLNLRPEYPLSVTPGDPGFRDTLNVLAHEMGHQWLAYARFREASGAVSSDLLDGSRAHWSSAFDSDGSVMNGTDWLAGPGGTFSVGRTVDTYSSLDLYLMGLLDRARVGALTLLRNAGIDPGLVPTEASTVTATPETVTVGQVVDAEGARQPDHLASPKAFRIGFIFLTKPGIDPDPEDLAAVDRIRQAFSGHFFALTRGVGIADTTLAEVPSLPAAPAPDLDKALAWLLAQQASDGSWQDAPGTAIRDTATVLTVLASLGRTEGPYATGRAWNDAMEPRSLDFLARRAMAIASSGISPTAASALAANLLSFQNPDGGFGAARGFASDALDTALALSALRALNQPLDDRVRLALGALSALRTNTGGWAFVPGGETSTVATASALLAVQDWAAAEESQPLLASGLVALQSRRNPDGGFGESPSTPYSTALALNVQLRAQAPRETVDGSIAFLQARQLPDGSWQGSRYQTALVLGALKGGVAPNLVVPADGLVVEPPSAREGATLRVTAVVRNAGRTAVPGSHARLYDGPPATSSPVGQATVPALDPEAEASVAFDFDTTGRAGDRTLYVVADANQEIAESREDDNTASRAVRVEGLLPDLVLQPGALAVSPYPPEEGETVQVSVTVRNSGEKASSPSLLRIVRGNPRLGGTTVGEAMVSAIAAGEAVTIAVPWDTTGQQGEFALFAVADASFVVPESDEVNNETSVPVEISAEAPPEPDLALASLTASPVSITRLPQALEVRALVRNLGRERAVGSIALYDADPPTGPAVAEIPVDIGPRSSVSIVFTPSVTSPGSRTFVAVADPAGSLAEADEENNRATVRVADPANTIDLEILPADVSASSTDLVAGDVLTVTATVRNRGTGGVPDVVVQLGHTEGGSVASLSERHVSIPGGGSASVTLSWTASLLGDPLALVVRVDPFGTLPELSEDNNAVPLSLRVRSSALTNLAVTGADISFDPPAPREGATVVVSARVRNPSPVAAPSFTVRFLHGDPDDGGEEIGETQIAGVEAGSSAVASIEWPLDVRGSQAIFVVADALDEVSEYDETDNRASRSLGVVGIADLVLAAADVRLSPEYPRAGEQVTISATVRNLGAQPSAENSLTAFEGEPFTGTEVNGVSVPALAPGESVTLSMTWDPSPPSGSRTLSLVLDLDELVPEQDEGNNVVRRTIVVQNADLYLSAPYFSPNGDGVKDETVLTYRATGAVTVAVADVGGRTVRTLLSNGPAVGNATWDGRNDAGILLVDGAYTLTVASSTGQVLGRIVATLDTNRSTLFDAAGTGLLSSGQNLTCSLPDFDESSFFTAWMPGDDEVLLLGHVEAAHQSVLARAGLDGTTRQLPTPGGRFASTKPVSPDGREVLVTDDSNLFAIDLTTGTSRMLGPPQYATRGVWSPDGHLIATDLQILRRDGSFVADLPEDVNQADAQWSPDGELVAFGFGFLREGESGTVILRKDGGEVRRWPFPADAGTVAGLTTWRGDGKLVLQALALCGVECGSYSYHTLDPLTGESRPLSWLGGDARSQAWSADGSRLLYGDGTFAAAREDGSEVIPIFPTSVEVSPRANAFLYRKWAFDTNTPGPAACPGKQFDAFAVVNVQNLTAELNVERLPGNSGLLLRGTASDAHLDRFEIEYATVEEPGIWNPIGAASEVPVIDETLAAFVPPEPGTYVIRLTASDRAGNVRRRTRVIAWNTFPSIANLTQDEFLISPNEDGVKDAVTVSYLVAEATGLDVRIVGPRPPAGSDAAAPTVRSFHLDYSDGDIGTQSIWWDGRDDGGQVARDGTYTIFLNDIPLRLEIDATPPDIAWAYENLRVDAGPSMVADRVWHVVDANLKNWSLSDTPLQGTEPIFVPERDGNGQLVLENGALKVKRSGAQAVSRRDRDEGVAELGVREGAVFAAEDHAGNKTTVPAFPVAERIFILGAGDGGPTPIMAAPIDPAVVYPFPPNGSITKVAETLRPPDQPLFFEYQRREEGAWQVSPTPLEHGAFGGDFTSMGLDPKKEYRGRFTGAGSTGEVSSEEFLFTPCTHRLTLFVTGLFALPAPRGPYLLEIVSEGTEPLAEASFYVVTSKQEKLGPFPMTLAERIGRREVYRAVYMGPASCGEDREILFGLVKTASGKVIDAGRNAEACVEMTTILPAACGSGFDLDLKQEYRSCAESSPDRIFIQAKGSSTELDAELDLTVGPPGPTTPAAHVDIPRPDLVFDRHLALDVTGRPEGELSIRGTVSAPGVPDSLTKELIAFVDRTPPAAEIFQPSEGAAVCVSPATARDTAMFTVVAQAVDHSPKLEISAVLKKDNGPWLPLSRICPDEACRKNGQVDSGAMVPLAFDVSRFPSGQYTVRLDFCDRAGNHSTVERSFFLNREPPGLKLVTVTRPVFSPNGDGRSDDSTVVVRASQATRVSAIVQTRLQGFVRTLFTDREFGATDIAVTWDGRDSSGQVVADGSYQFVLTANDPCGRTSTIAAPVDVDNTPPTAEITQPVANETIGLGVDVRGRAEDLHIASYELSVGAGATPTTWTALTTSSFGVDGVLGRWDPVTDGPYRLRLLVTDRAENQSEAQVPVTRHPSDFLDRLTASPSIFSPNGDGRRDAATLTYVLKTAGRVTLSVVNGQGIAVRTIESAVVHPAGTYAHVWDGRADAGTAVPDADYVVSIRVEDSVGTAPSQEATAGVTVDRAPPAIVVDHPVSGAFVLRNAPVHGLVQDPHLSGYVLTARSSLDGPVELARGGQNRTDFDLASFASLLDGSYVLTVSADDAAENRTDLDVPFTLDSTPPTVAFSSPAAGAVLRRGTAPIEVRGLALDANLQDYVLSFGAGPEPSSFVEIARSTQPGVEIVLGAWAGTYIPDGEYTLRLVATDRAGHTSEARRSVTLDATPPLARIDSPDDGAFVGGAPVIGGTASDANLESWTLEAKPGQDVAGFDWLPVGTGTTSVVDGTLATWAPLPPDGVYTLRLTAKDRTGLISTAQRSVVVDTMPPAAPTGLAATIHPHGSLGDVALTWNANSEPDLAGYRVARDDQGLSPEILPVPGHRDADRTEGAFRYAVVAIDRAGNVSTPATLTVRVDLTPPIADILRPLASSVVSGSVDVRGSAFSLSDFKEYRLLIGQGTSPTEFSVIARSGVAVRASALGSWTATVDGPYVLTLEAEDTTGNVARATVPLVVDTQAPAAPHLHAVAAPTALEPDRLTLHWDPSASPDVAGYLVYRNGHLANASGVVVGDLRPFLVPGLAYDDRSLPDGTHCYRIVAMDQAGNTSEPSNQECPADPLDNRSPRAVIVQPQDGTRFEFPLRITAESPDLDIASVQFQYKGATDPDFVPFGPPATHAPYQTTLDPGPLGFPPGSYDIRAVAIDQTDHVDPDPQSIQVIFGDLTAPRSPTDVVAHVDGHDVTLTWSAATEGDLAGYKVFRDGTLIADDVTETTLTDAGVALGSHAYTVAAFDNDDNVSLPSPPAPALVYALTVAPPFPVTTAGTASLAGTGAQAETTVRIRQRTDTDPVLVGEAPAAGDTFAVVGVPLQPGLNLLYAQAEDALGNRSVPSDDAGLIQNAPPGAVANLTAGVTGHRVALSWDPVPDGDLFGYRVFRDGAPVKDSSPQSAFTEVFSNRFTSTPPTNAFDGDPRTVWTLTSSSTPAEWTVVFPAPVLVERIVLKMTSPSVQDVAARKYRILARLEGHLLPIVRVDANVKTEVEHVLPSPLAIDGFTIAFDSPVTLADVEVFKRDLVAAGTTAFEEEPVADGAHGYRVLAVDRHGAEGAPGEVQAVVGDVVAPAPILDLSAQVTGRDVLLTWTASSEADFHHYVVRRDDAAIGTTTTATFSDLGLPNGAYSYTVVAVDAVGNPSAESNRADIQVDVAPEPPSAPVILFPTDAAHPITLDSARTDVRGSAPLESVVALSVNGEFRGATATRPRLTTTATFSVPEDGSVWSPDGSRSGRVISENPVDQITVTDRSSGQTRSFDSPGLYTQIFAFSPDGSRLLLRAYPPASSRRGAYVMDATTGQTTLVSEASDDVNDAVWDPAGKSVGYLAAGRLVVYSLESGDLRSQSFSDDDFEYALSLAPDGQRSAFIRADHLTDKLQLHVMDLMTGADTFIADAPWWEGRPSWSADGSQLAFTSAADATGDVRPHVMIHDFRTGQSHVVGDSGMSFGAAFDPGGGWLSFADVVASPAGPQESVVVQPVAGGPREVVAGPTTIYSADDGSLRLNAWPRAGHLAVVLRDTATLVAEDRGAFEFKAVRLSPGENELTAMAADPSSGLMSPDSEPVLVSTGDLEFPDLAVVGSGLSVSPGVPTLGRPTVVSGRVENLGDRDVTGVPVRLTVLGPAGVAPVTQVASLSIPAGESVLMSMSWTPTELGEYRVVVEADSDDGVAEAREDNNQASRDIVVRPTTELVAIVEADRNAYGARSPVVVRVQLGNGGAAFDGTVTTTVEDSSGRPVALLDVRTIALGFGDETDFVIGWTTGSLFAGDYVFHVRAREPGATSHRAQGVRPFTILPELTTFGRIVPDQPTVADGALAGFAVRVESRGSNVALTGAKGHLRIVPVPAVTGSLPVFEADADIPTLLPGGVWEGHYTWSPATPVGAYRAEFEVRRTGGQPLAGAAAALVVAPAGVSVTGTLGLVPGEVLAGAPSDALVSLTNQGATPLTGYPVAVEVMAGGTTAVAESETTSVDLLPGETRQVTVRLSTGSLAPNAYPVLLRGGAPAVSLDRSRLRVHGMIAPPSIDAPADGSKVATSHPVLAVNNASTPEGALLTYEFEIFTDTEMQQRVAAGALVPETPVLTKWRVDVNLAEDRTFYWRARATHDSIFSAWTPVAAFAVDAVNLSPSAPVPDAPAAGARVATRQPMLIVANAVDAELDVLTYEFRVATDPGMTAVLASSVDLPEGPGLTSWTVPVFLDEDSTYFWSARASDGYASSPWSEVIAFTVDTVNETPTAPSPLRPVGGVEVATLTPALVVANAEDPEGDPLTYHFEIDTVPTFGSPDLQVSPGVPEGTGETAWVPALPLKDNTVYYWRAATADGHTTSAFAGSHLFVNLANDPPGVPLLLDPVDARTVRTATPTLRLRNAVDPDGETLAYEFEVTDVSGQVVASAPPVPEGVTETTWTVDVPLAENQTFAWRARAHDHAVAGAWTDPAMFRVNAVAEPPTGPVLVAPIEGAVVETHRPTLEVSNASSPEALPLTYAFEIYRVETSGSLTLVDQVGGVPEGIATTTWAPSLDLPDGSYSWRARAADPAQVGPWMASAHFTVRTDLPPAPPLDLRAVPGDASVSLTWRASPEPDVTGYRVYRAAAASGPFSFVGASVSPAFVDGGRTNGVTVYYAVTALDAHFESARSNVVAATPTAPPPTLVVAEVRFDPAAIAGECLLPREHGGHHDDDDGCRPSACPEWLYVTLELPAGLDPARIDRASVRLAGSVPADSGYRTIVDVDHDGLPEARFRFRFTSVAGLLGSGRNDLTVMARTPESEVRGTGRLDVGLLTADMKFTPQTLNRRSQGSDVEAQLTLCCDVKARDVLVSSLRLNGRVAPSRIVVASSHKLIVKFNRAAVIAILPVGEHVEVRVTGSAGRLSFEGRDVIRVTQ